MTLLERIARVERRGGRAADAAIADTCTERFGIAMAEIGKLDERLDAIADAIVELRAKANVAAAHPVANRPRPCFGARVLS
ncbi:MAG TPA: hypothetical protein VNF29_10880 [Candidatus Binataceae bacterium]|nr:hypothetical protein [Candidatus Binataceae bacterium]